MSGDNLDEIKTALSNISNNNVIHEGIDKLSTTKTHEKDYTRTQMEQMLREEIKNLKSTREMREDYAQKSYKFAKCTLIGWAVLVFLYVIVPDKNKIMDVKTFGIITTACTINILIAFHAVIKGLFSHK